MQFCNRAMTVFCIKTCIYQKKVVPLRQIWRRKEIIMNDKEVYEYRAQVREYIEALGRNPEEELPLVTIEEMRAWIDDFENEEREQAKAEEGENYDPEMWEGTLYPD